MLCAIPENSLAVKGVALKVGDGLLDDWWNGIPLVLAKKFQRNSKLLRIVLGKTRYRETAHDR